MRSVMASDSKTKCNCSAMGICSRINRDISKSEFAICSRLGSDIADRVIASRVTDAKKAIAKPVSRPSAVPNVSTFGTQLRSAFESAMGTTITCGSCLTFLCSLNRTETHNTNEIIVALVAQLNIPQAIRKQHTNLQALREWVASIVDAEYGKMKALGPS